MKLDPLARRIIGVLIEKEATTPAQYPLSVNALTNACNQKSNRHPVINVPEATVHTALRDLYVEEWVTNVGQAGSRILKWKHRCAEKLNLEGKPLAVLAELLLRGAQQPGELRARASRMVPIPDLANLELVAETLQDAGLLRRLPPQPGERSGRFDHDLYIEETETETEAGATPPADEELGAPVASEPLATSTLEESSPVKNEDEDRLRILEDRIDDLTRRLESLEQDRPDAESRP